MSFAILVSRIPGGFAGALSRNAAAGQPARLFDFAFDPSQPYTFWAGVVGGAFLAMASHGADQLIVQRLLACRGLRDAQKALVGSGVLVILQFALFLSIGVCLFAFYGSPVGARGRLPDERRDLPDVHREGAAGMALGVPRRRDLLRGDVLGVVGAELARLGALARLRGAARREGGRRGAEGATPRAAADSLLDGRPRGPRVGFSLIPQGQPAVQVALGLASVTGGGLLGAFLLALYVRKARQADALVAIGVSAVFMFLLWLGARGYLPFPLGKGIAWPWYSMLGAGITVGVGWLLSRRHASDDPAVDPLRVTSRA